MELILILLALSAAIFMSMAIGASAIASAFAPVASSGSSNILRSALLAGIAALLGGLIQGRKVTETVGSGILGGSIGVVQAVTILLIASVLGIASTLTNYPMPTAFTVVGAVVGSGIGFGSAVQWGMVKLILGYWLLVPLFGVGLGYVTFLVVDHLVPKEKNEERVRYVVLFLGLVLAFTAGANSIGKAIGPLNALDMNITHLLIMGSVAMMVGSWILSPRIINAISYDYSNIGPRRSMVALGTAAFLTQIGTFLGVPISFAQAIIAAVIGSGAAVGTTNIGKRKVMLTVGGWITAFLASMGLAFVIGHFIF
ncbi:MAG: inorganic phosphate transporter [Thermoplasmata archaeon]